MGGPKRQWKVRSSFWDFCERTLGASKEILWKLNERWIEGRLYASAGRDLKRKNILWRSEKTTKGPKMFRGGLNGPSGSDEIEVLKGQSRSQRAI